MCTEAEMNVRPWSWCEFLVGFLKKDWLIFCVTTNIVVAILFSPLIEKEVVALIALPIVWIWGCVIVVILLGRSLQTAVSKAEIKANLTANLTKTISESLAKGLESSGGKSGKA